MPSPDAGMLSALARCRSQTLSRELNATTAAKPSQANELAAVEYTWLPAQRGPL
jgi:hypothetical protein